MRSSGGWMDQPIRRDWSPDEFAHNETEEPLMSPIFTTFLTSLLATIGVPWAEKHFNITLPPTEQTTLTAGCVGAVTAAAHWMHVKVFTRRRHR
jgi:hypothetical protein